MAAVAFRFVRAVGGNGAPAVRGVVEGQGVSEAPPPGPRRARFPRRVGLVSLCDRLRQHSSPEKEELTGSNPVDRGKYGSKSHLITERLVCPCRIGNQFRIRHHEYTSHDLPNDAAKDCLFIRCANVIAHVLRQTGRMTSTPR